MKYRRDIDGLRALAVVPVILFHASASWFRGGYLGVDVFFVISGYLITAILIQENEANAFSILGFYERRARRILPGLFFVVAVCVPFAFLWMTPDQLHSFFSSVWAVALFGSNILFWKEAGYFAPSAILKPLIHTWSLAVEEQYYVIFPLVVALFWRFGKRSVAGIIAFTAACSLILAQIGGNLSTHPPFIEHDFRWLAMPAFAFYLAPTRAWELMLGGLAAMYLNWRGAPKGLLSQIGSALGITMILAAMLFFNAETAIPAGPALLPTIGATLIILCNDTNGPAGKLLASRPFVGIGLISYSLYLWHQPLFAFARLRSSIEPSAYTFAALTALAFVLAFLSWRYVERPFRDRAWISRAQIFALSGAGIALLFSGGFAGAAFGGFKDQYLSHLTTAQRSVYHAIEDAVSPELIDRMQDDGKCKFWREHIDTEFKSRFATCAQTQGSALLVLGDSHAMNLYNALFDAAEGSFIVGLSQPGCRLDQPKSSCPFSEAQKFVQTHRMEFKRILYTQKGSYYLHDFRNLPVDQKAFAASRDYLASLGTFAQVTWFGPWIEPGVDLRGINLAIGRCPPLDHTLMTNVRALDTLLAVALRASSDIKYISTIDALHFDPTRDYFAGGRFTYSDKDHWSAFGEQFFGTRIVTFLRRGGIDGI